MKSLIKRFGIVLLGLVMGGVVATLVVMGMVPLPFGPMAEARAAAERARPPVTVMYATPDRVVNLADTDKSRYLKTQLTLEFIDTSVKEPPKAAGV